MGDHLNVALGSLAILGNPFGDRLGPRPERQVPVVDLADEIRRIDVRVVVTADGSEIRCPGSERRLGAAECGNADPGERESYLCAPVSDAR